MIVGSPASKMTKIQTGVKVFTATGNSVVTAETTKVTLRWCRGSSYCDTRTQYTSFGTQSMKL